LFTGKEIMENLCYNHPRREAIGHCEICRRPFCSRCLIEDETGTRCKSKLCRQAFGSRPDWQKARSGKRSTESPASPATISAPPASGEQTESPYAQTKEAAGGEPERTTVSSTIRDLLLRHLGNPPPSTEGEAPESTGTKTAGETEPSGKAGRFRERPPESARASQTVRTEDRSAAGTPPEDRRSRRWKADREARSTATGEAATTPRPAPPADFPAGQTAVEATAFDFWWCLGESWRITRAAPGAFLGATVLAVATAIPTLSLTVPALFAGLEGMYLRRFRGREVRASDVFMHMRKTVPLLAASILIFLDSLVAAVRVFIFPVFLAVAMFPWRSPDPGATVVLAGLLVLSAVLVNVVMFYRGGRYLHTFNFIAEESVTIREGMRRSRDTVVNRKGAAVLTFLFYLAWGGLTSYPGVESGNFRLAAVCFGLVMLPVLSGAAALAFLQETGGSAGPGTKLETQTNTHPASTSPS
jgi:hypothetical protein